MALPVSATPTDPYGLGQLYPYVIPADSGGSTAPTYYDSGYSSGGGGGTTSSAPAVDSSAIAGYDQSIGNVNAGINRLGSQLSSGNSAIDASYTNALNQLLLGENQAKSTYQTNKHQTAVDYVGGKNTIRSNAGSSLNSLQRLLGSRGAGGSSASLFAAPGAVARQATIQQGDLSGVFGKNNQALDTNWGNYEVGVNNQRSSAASQRDQQRQSLQSQIDNNRASLLQTLAQLQAQRAAAAGGNPVGAAQPYLDQANSVLDAASRYTIAPITYQTQAYTAPDLNKYIVNPNAAPQYQGQTQANDYFSPYLQALLGKDKQLQGTPA